MEKGNLMKKKLLITAMSLNVGGAEKSLVNLLNMIDFLKYDVDLLLFQRRGAFLKQVPSTVNIITVPEIEVLYQPISETVKKYKFNIKLLVLSIIRYLSTFYEKYKWKQFDRIRIHRWIDIYSKLIPFNNSHYDVAISFAGGETAYYIADKVSASKTIYFFHSNYANIDIDTELEQYYIDKFSKIITISDVCANSLISLFKNIDNKLYILQNLTSYDLIQSLSNEYYPNEYKSTNQIILVSVGRLHKIKGYDIAIESAKILKDKGLDFKWFIVGEGSERKSLEEQIHNNKLKNTFILLGLKENPYPYIKNADILVQSSRFEGKSVVLDEAKMLNIPIVVTNYASAYEQIDNEKTGIIANIDSESMANGIYRLCNEKKLYNSIKKNQKSITFEKENDIENYMNILCN